MESPTFKVKYFKDILSDLQNNLDLNVTETARKLGITRQTWYRWVQGKGTISLEQIKQLCTLTGFSLNGLIAHQTPLPSSISSKLLSLTNTSTFLKPASLTPKIDTLILNYEPGCRDDILVQIRKPYLFNASFLAPTFLSHSICSSRGYKKGIRLENSFFFCDPFHSGAQWARLEFHALSRPLAISPSLLFRRFVLPDNGPHWRARCLSLFQTLAVSRVDVACDYQNPALSLGLDHPACRSSSFSQFLFHNRVTSSYRKGSAKRSHVVCYSDSEKAARVEARVRPPRLALRWLACLPSPFLGWRLFNLSPAATPFASVRSLLAGCREVRVLLADWPGLAPWLEVRGDPFHPHAWVSRCWGAVVCRLARQLAVPPAWLGLDATANHNPVTSWTPQTCNLPQRP